MIYKIANTRDMNTLPPMADGVYHLLYNHASLLTNLYGADRNVDLDDGGYILYAEEGTTETELQKQFDYTQYSVEYVSVFDDLTPAIATATYLLNNEYAVMLVIAYSDLPNEIKKEI